MWLPNVCIKLDQLALMKSLRQGSKPSLLKYAYGLEHCGVNSLALTMMQREHWISKEELHNLIQLAELPLNLISTMSQDNLRLAYEMKPERVTVIPELGEQAFTAEGLDVLQNKEQLKSFSQGLKDAEIAVGVMLDADLDQMRQAHKLDLDCVTINTRKLFESRTESMLEAELQRIADVAKSAHRLGMEVTVGGSLTAREIPYLMVIEEITTIEIGHWFWNQALYYGIEASGGRIKQLLRDGPKR